jgi:hypothetical protein
MSSLGESRISVNSWMAGKVRVLNIFPDAALYPRLGMTLGVILNDLTSRGPDGISGPVYEWHGVSGELRLAQNSAAIGLLFELKPTRPFGPTSSVYEEQIRLVCELDSLRLEAIERNRNGQPPHVWVELWPRLVSDRRSEVATVQSFRLEISREQWLEFLTAVGGSEFDVLEIRYTAREAERFKRAIARTRDARLQIANGEYDSAVAECRKVLEALAHEVKEEGQKDPLTPLFEKRTDERRAKEYAGIVSRIKQLSGFVHHDFGKPLTYTRAEAQFVLRTTESLLAFVGALSTSP